LEQLLWVRGMAREAMARLRCLGLADGWILVIGLAMEYWGHRGETGILDSNNAALYDDAKQAEKDAGGLKLIAARMGVTNSQLSLRIEELRQQNDALEAKQIRIITPENRDKFIGLLKNYPKCPVRIFIESNERETVIYANQVREMLDGAGYECQSNGITQIGLYASFSIDDKTRNMPIFILYYGKRDQIIDRPNLKIRFNPGGIAFTQFGTNGVDGVPGMIGDAFGKIGVNFTIESEDVYSFLQPEGWGIYIPQRF
jgi:hypothetical protein